MNLKSFQRPWRIVDNGSAFNVRDFRGRTLAAIYYHESPTAQSMGYLSKDEAKDMAQTIARLSVGQR